MASRIDSDDSSMHVGPIAKFIHSALIAHHSSKKELKRYPLYNVNLGLEGWIKSFNSPQSLVSYAKSLEPWSGLIGSYMMMSDGELRKGNQYGLHDLDVTIDLESHQPNKPTQASMGNHLIAHSNDGTVFRIINKNDSFYDMDINEGYESLQRRPRYTLMGLFRAKLPFGNELLAKWSDEYTHEHRTLDEIDVIFDELEYGCPEINKKGFMKNLDGYSQEPETRHYQRFVEQFPNSLSSNEVKWRLLRNMYNKHISDQERFVR
ncbi:hypothetical protein C0585_02220 [Candidatus Woesearchaeota archaeon]|mgnify:CR=1 FL=1|nr:MAG: hypothetical protein C0585_02220 [Candidatus Woesearchaeota archaeon]